MSGNWMPDKLRATLTYVLGGVTLFKEITDDVINWGELTTAMQRDGFSGVFTSVDMPIQVAFTTKKLLHDLFFESFLSTVATIRIEQRDAFDLDVYTEIYRAKLDFSTFVEHPDRAEISSSVRDFNSLVKSVGKTKYDIPAADIATANWQYQHNQVFVNGDWTIPENSIGMPDYPQIRYRYRFVLSLDDAKQPFGGALDDIKDQSLKESMNDDVFDDWFFESDINSTPNRQIAININFDFSYNFFQVDVNNTYFRVSKTSSDGTVSHPISVSMSEMTGVSADPLVFNISINKSIYINPGDKLAFTIDVLLTSGTTSGVLSIVKFNSFYLRYIDKTAHTDSIPVVTPVDFANRLLYEMAGGDNGVDESKLYIVQFDADTDNPWPFDHYLVAAESIRGFEDAKFHANFNGFLEYMQFLGYEWDVDEAARVVNFRKRGKFFDPTVTALEMDESEVAGLVISASDDYAWSTVQVGYEKPDIDNTNGRFALCGAFDYSTDFANTGGESDSSLEIKCPYKADPVEIEILSWTRGEKTTDKKTDNDIFMLAGELSGGNVVETRRSEYVVTDADLGKSIGWYNVPYIPYFITRRNAEKIGITVKNLKFTGTDSYRDATMRGTMGATDIYGDIRVLNSLFSPVVYEFAAGTYQNLPAVTEGVVRFPWKGARAQGFIQKLTKAHNAESPASWTLLGCRDVSDEQEYSIVVRGQVTEEEVPIYDITVRGQVAEEA